MATFECTRSARCEDCLLRDKELHGKVYWHYCVKDPRNPKRIKLKDSICNSFIWEMTKMKKIEIPEEDFSFLKDLQNELLNQDTDGQADPRFWSILETKEEPAPEGIGTPVIYMGDGGTMTLEEAIKYIEDDYLPNEEQECKDIWEDLDKNNMDEVVNFMHDMFDWKDTRVVYLDTQKRVTEQTGCFITKRACKQHIENNRHHYSRPQTYAMTAWRNPEFERLIEILKRINLKEE